MTQPAVSKRTKPLLLFDGECAVCRTIARWVTAAATDPAGATSLVIRPIGDDPDELRTLNADLNIWDAYATIHVLMPDGSMKRGGEAVAEVFRALPSTHWFAWLFSIGIAGIRPFQPVLDAGYTILADVRPMLGCESCGTSNAVVRFLARRKSAHHFTPKRARVT
jgi:predicted DCC family thiol-disulfide oxidoreductase YuxK